VVVGPVVVPDKHLCDTHLVVGLTCGARDARGRGYLVFGFRLEQRLR
jgi:hypothetical protein